MIVCLACYEDRLASIFENATEYKFFEVRDNGEICPAGHLSLPSKDPTDRTSAIMACGVSHLICGAVCYQTRKAIETTGMQLFPFIKGAVEEVLHAFREDSLHSLAMPGCRRQMRCRGEPDLGV